MPIARFVLGVAILGMLAGAARAQAGGDGARALELMKKQQYADAIKLLTDEMRAKPETATGRNYVLLGECLYMTRQYDKAGPCFEKAFEKSADANDKIISQYRQACIAYRIGEYNDASRKIDAFNTAYPNDARVGKLLGYKMLILASKGAGAEKQLEEIHEKIYAKIDRYDAITGMEADQILCDFYRRHGRTDKAESLYTRLVHNFRKVIAEREKEKLPIPAAMEKAHDNAALQLGIMALEKKNAPEATKWLENVRYDQEHKIRARLLLAKIAYEKNDYRLAQAHLMGGDFIETVPAGPIKSDMYLILGLSEKSRPDGNAGKVEEYLKRVAPGSQGFTQAQLSLGDIYREKSLFERAIECYKNLVASSEHGAHAMFHLAGIYMDQARQLASDPTKERALLKEAAKLYERLFERYPLSPYAKQSKERVEQLAAKGIDVSFAQSGDDMVKAWEKTAADKAGGVEGAQSLMSLVRHHFKRVMEEKSSKFVKAPNYAACAAAADKLLDEKVYAGKGFEGDAWKQLRCEAYYHRGLCELASIGANPDAVPGAIKPVYLPKASAAAAAEFLTKAKQLIDARQLDLVKGIELALLEALFKSDKPADREAAERRFSELEGDYGTDPRFQKLAIDLADWYQQQGRLADAAKAYAGVADRGRDLPEDDVMRLLYTAGSLYSRAGFESQQKAGATGFCLYVYPKETIQFGDSLLKSYAPLGRSVDMVWPKGGKCKAGEALAALSKASGIPFIWSLDRGADTIANYLDTRDVQLPESGRITVADALGLILDMKRHRIDFDSGLVDGKPTIEAAGNDEDPDNEKPRTIELYDVSQSYTRFKPLGRSYGNWREVHSGTGRSGVMLFHVVQRIENVTRTRVVWADGIDVQSKLAFEYRDVPGGSNNATCAAILSAALDAAELRFKPMQRDVATDHYEAAKDCFNKIRKIAPTSKYGEKSLFAVALNFYNQKEYQKMKLVLREYLKVFDAPGSEFYHEACFWVGWAFENERKFREAASYYARAAEEFIVIDKLRPGEKPRSRQELRKSLAYDSQFALSEKLGGDLSKASIIDLAEFIRINTHVGVKVDPTVDAKMPATRPAFRGVAAFDLLIDTLEPLGLTFRVDNVSRKAAERAYFRLAWVYRKDNLMDQALENCNALLDRYPQTPRKREAQRLMVDIHRGLRDYQKVLALLEELRASAADEAEKRRLAIEIGWIHFDMADYEGAARSFKGSLELARTPEDILSVRDGYARALLRSDKLDEALGVYETLSKAAASPLRAYVYKLLTFYLKFATNKAQAQEFPDDADRFVQKYEQLSDDQRSRLSPADLAKATWIYYVKGLMDLKMNRPKDAVERFVAVSNSPDEFIAADAGYQLGLLHMREGRFDKARDAFEYLLFATRSSESAVRATFMLGVCHEKLGKPDKALERYDEIIRRYPLSPFVQHVRKNPLYQQGLRNGASRPSVGAVAPER